MGEHAREPGVGAEFLASTDVVDWYHPDVHALAWLLSAGVSDPVEIARRCYLWVRDEIRHSVDYGETRVTCTASEVLAQRTGFCYAKSHLLAALLRANDIPAGFCYQRLAVNDTGPPYCLHGLNAVYLPTIGWYRLDPRGNKLGIHAKFAPPQEHLPFPADQPGEIALPQILPEPLPVVVAALRKHPTVATVCANLPDVPLAGTASIQRASPKNRP